MKLSNEDIARIEEQVKTLFNDVVELKEDVRCIKDQLANRLPVWATLAISALMGLCGFLGGESTLRRFIMAKTYIILHHSSNSGRNRLQRF